MDFNGKYSLFKLDSLVILVLGTIGSIGGSGVNSSVISGGGVVGDVDLDVSYNMNRGEIWITDLTDLLITV